MSLARITIHSSQFPQAVRTDLLDSLRSRRVNHKFHYDSVKQTHKWLQLHQAYSPSRTDPNCTAIYQQSFQTMLKPLRSRGVHVIGLGCGGGQKDTVLLEHLRQSGREIFYTPVDVSTAMVLVARQTALRVVPEQNCFPLVCDLATASDLPEVLSTTVTADLAGANPEHNCVFTFFGMLPNFEPEAILPKLAGLVRVGDNLLLSANLAPGNDYAAGVKKILPLYDNALTRDWLMTFLLDLGVEKTDGELRFAIEERPGPPLLKRVTAHFHFAQDRLIQIESECFQFHAGEAIRVFFSYRHTPSLLESLLARHGFKTLNQWITPSEEEGVFLVGKS